MQTQCVTWHAGVHTAVNHRNHQANGTKEIIRLDDYKFLGDQELISGLILEAAHSISHCSKPYSDFTQPQIRLEGVKKTHLAQRETKLPKKKVTRFGQSWRWKLLSFCPIISIGDHCYRIEWLTNVKPWITHLQGVCVCMCVCVQMCVCTYMCVYPCEGPEGLSLAIVTLRLAAENMPHSEPWAQWLRKVPSWVFMCTCVHVQARDSPQLLSLMSLIGLECAT